MVNVRGGDVVEPNPGALPFPVPVEAQARFLRQFAVKCKAGLSVDKCLAALAGDSKHRPVRAMCRSLHDEVVRGAPLSVVMREQEVFDSVVVAIVEAAERSGQLTAALGHAADYVERAGRLRRGMHEAVATPLNALSLVLLAIFAAAVALAFLVREVVPEAQLVHVGGSVSLLDRLAVEVARFVRKAWPFVGGAGGLGFIALHLVPRSPKARLFLERMGLKLPLFSAALEATGQAILARTTATLMQTGALLGDAVTVATSLLPYAFLRTRMTDTIAAIEAGQSYIEAFVAVGFFHRREITAVQAAERREAFGPVMAGLADEREREAAARIGTLKTVAHTVVVVILAVTTAAVVLALYVPVFVSH